MKRVLITLENETTTPVGRVTALTRLTRPTNPGCCFIVIPPGAQSSGGGGARTSRLPLDSRGPTTPAISICSTMRAARL